MKRILGLCLLVLTLVLSASAQTAYKTPQFSVTFAGSSVDAWSKPNKQNTSVDYFYASTTDGAFSIEQTVAYRVIGAPIDVNTTSLDFYVSVLTHEGETLKSKEYVPDFQGHIAVAFSVFTTTGRIRRHLLIIHDERTVFILMQSTALGNVDDKQWSDFVNSFGMNEKACWLPEGCN